MAQGTCSAAKLGTCTPQHVQLNDMELVRQRLWTDTLCKYGNALITDGFQTQEQNAVKTQHSIADGCGALTQPL
jgi:hypothetical protein